MTRVLIVAAYASVRAGLHALLGEAEDVQVIGESSGSADLERLLADARPDIVLADDLPDDRARLLSLLSEGEIGLVLLGEGRDGYVRLAGARLPGWGYLLKDADGEEIAGAVRAAAAGLIALDRSLAGLLVGRVGGGVVTEVGVPGEGLTAREREVLQLVALGLPNKQIAARLSVSLHTAKFHVASVLAKLGASSRTEAVAVGARRGEVSL